MAPNSYFFSAVESIVCSPAYGRQFVSSKAALDNFNRGLDWIHQPSGKYMSIRDCAPGCVIQLRYGKRLQKAIAFTIPQPSKARNHALKQFATLQVAHILRALRFIDKPGEVTRLTVRRAFADYKPTYDEVMLWVEKGHISSICAEIICKTYLS